MARIIKISGGRVKTYPVGVFPRVVVIAVILLLGAMGVGYAGGKVAAWGESHYGQTILPYGLKDVRSIAGGSAHSLALKANGTVVGWGLDDYGQANPPAGLNGVVAIAAGGSLSLALRANGTVFAWGNNSWGQTNVPANLSHVIGVATGGGHCLALKADGTVVVWSSLPGSYSNTNIPPGLAGVRAVAAGTFHSLVLTAEGTVVAWGNNNYGQTNVPAGLSNVVAIAAGYRHNLALKADGTVAAWGYGSWGLTNVPGGLSDVVAIAAGDFVNLALKADGTLVSWGDGTYGLTNLPPGISNVTAIACGSAHSLALVSDGPPEILDPPADVGVPYQSNIVLSVTASGYELLSYHWFFEGKPLTNSARMSGVTTASLRLSNAQFSDIGTYTVIVSNAFGSVQSSGAVLTVISPPIITTQPVGQTVIAGTNISLTASAIGTPPLSYQWTLGGLPINGATAAVLSLTNFQSSQGGAYSVIVSNEYGTQTSSNALVMVLESAPYILGQPATQSVILGGLATLSVNARGSTPMTYQWRFNGADLPGANDPVLVLTPARFDQAGFYTLAISNAFGSIVSSKAELTVRQVAVWGATIPVRLPTNVPPGLTNLVAISANESYVLGLKADGTVAIWYSAARLPIVPTNVPPGLSNVISIAAGEQHCLALRSNGTVTAWGGASDFYYFPPYPVTPSPTNVPANLSNVIAIAAGAAHSLALKADGQVVGWGLTKPATAPAGLSNVIAIAAGANQSLALKSDGRVVAWGNSSNVPVTLSNVIALACSDGYNLALQTNGRVSAWPALPYPILVPSPKAPPLATNVPPGLSNVVAIAAGVYGMALQSDGKVSAWGSSVPQTPAGLSNVFAISGGDGFMAALISDGSPRFTIQPVSQTVSNGGQVQFHARAVGVTPLSYQWQLDGTNLPGAINADLMITDAHGKNTGGYRLLAANALGSTASVVATLTIPFSTNLAAAVNATHLDWTNTTPEALWFAQIRESHDGDAAAQSGVIGNNRQSVLQTTVTGPGMLSFWWKVSSEEGYDFLNFFVDQAATPWSSLSGEEAWQQQTIPLTSGTHTLKWSYQKDGSVSASQDAGWLDEVVFTPAPAITLQPLGQTVWAGSNVTFRGAASSAVIAFYQWLKNDTNLPGAFGSLLTLTNVGRRDSGNYALRVSNAGGTVTSSNATLIVRVAQSLSAPRFLPDGSFVFRSGDADGGWLMPEDLTAFAVQASTNLHDWITLTNACTLTNGALLLRDPDGTRHPQRFYRLEER